MQGICGNVEAGTEIPVMFAGGISEKKDILFPTIEKYLKGAHCKLIKLECEPVEGALRRAQKIFEDKQREH